MKRILTLFALFVIAAVVCNTAWSEDSAASADQPSSIYSYSDNDVPSVFFFPPDKARWNGYKVTMREWYMLTELQKERFISEYLGELKSQYKAALDVVGGDYLEALNVFSYYSNDKAAKESPAKFIDKLLEGQKKI